MRSRLRQTGDLHKMLFMCVVDCHAGRTRENNVFVEPRLSFIILLGKNGSERSKELARRDGISLYNVFVILVRVTRPERGKGADCGVSYLLRRVSPHSHPV